jgi:hypothetical protein
MAKASKNTKTAAAKPAAAKRAAAQQPVVRSAAAAQAKQEANPATALYQVLEPFWLGGATVKPHTPDGAPVFVEMTQAEAEPYQQAGVLGTEASDAPDTHDSEPSGGQDATNASGAQDGA